MKIAHKLGAGFGVMCLLVLLPLFYESRKVDDALTLVTVVSQHDVQATELLKEIAVLQSDLRSSRERAITETVIARAEGRSADIEPFRRAYLEEAERVRVAVTRLHSLAQESADLRVSEERAGLWTELVRRAGTLGDAFQSVQREAATLFDLLLQGRDAEARGLQPRLDSLREIIDANIEAGSAITRQLARAGEENIRRIHDEVIRSAILASLVAVAVATLIAVLTSRSITARLREAVSLAARVKEGDLTRSLEVDGDDELAMLGRDLNDMTAKLRAVATTTRATAESMHAATAQIRASTQQQAASVSQQLAAVEETTATLSEITESGAQISRRAREVSASAQTASATSETGLKAVEDTNTAMDAIREQAEAVAENIVILSERTQAIGEIIVTVNDIAERCHLLALNAAIEAAAAGEHGRTFAIVAAEIKSLADQSKEATVQVRSNLSEIQHGINSSVMLTEEAVKRVAAGKRQTDAAQGTIRDMAGSIQESVIAFQQIVTGTNQQQIGLEQVTQALQNIRSAGSQTAAGTRQLEGAATSLNDLGQGLVEAVRYYRV
ncbi:methyl-accepting chemotaxis protein [Azospirillum sp. SYSU D00513]|uniref:methyl-accepting chemotaxis protein n=1 Tax=Azospirillum sp. SYSU D00513 TaxID=2812561 RepID=UPI0032B42FCE